MQCSSFLPRERNLPESGFEQLPGSCLFVSGLMIVFDLKVAELAMNTPDTRTFLIASKL